jgi:hypothetical protein
VCSYTLRPFLTLASVVWVSELEPVGDDFVNRETTYMDTQIHANFRSRVVNHEESDPANFSTLSFVVFEDQGDIQMSAYLHFEGGPVEWFCSADPSQGCPCGFSSYDPRGCPNSAHPDGAGLAGTGFASTAHDTLTLEFTDLPANTTALLFQSTSTSHSVLGDGVRCLGSPIKRFPLRNANASGATGYGSAYGDVPISVYGAVPPIGGVFNYQVWYRDSAAFCTPATTNLTHAVKVSWTP